MGNENTGKNFRTDRRRLDEQVMSTQAERSLLGALLIDARFFRNVIRTVTSEDFSEMDYGKVFDGIGQMVSNSEVVDAITVSGKFPTWQVKIPLVEVHKWQAEANYAYAAAQYAETVRNDAIRRRLGTLVDVIQHKRLDPSVEPLDVATEASNFLEELRNGIRTNGLASKTLSEILQGDDSYDWIVPGLLERQDRLIVTGPEGFGKTTFIRQLTILAAAGINPITFEQIKPVRVLVIDAENTERQWRRAVRFMSEKAANMGVIDPRATIQVAAGKRIDITKGSHLSDIHRLIDEHKPDMLMIGPLYKLVPKAINNDDDAAPLIVALDSLRERGLTLIMEAHAGKASNLEGERDLRPRGSAALLGWPEFGFGLRPVVGETDVVQLSRWRGDRDERLWPRRMRRGGVWPWMPDDSVNVPDGEW
jgi:hypothetical protein